MKERLFFFFKGEPLTKVSRQIVFGKGCCGQHGGVDSVVERSDPVLPPEQGAEELFEQLCLADATRTGKNSALCYALVCLEYPAGEIGQHFCSSEKILFLECTK